jgi:ribosomal protein S18 acetylase RimI-like enzyme
MIIRAATVSDAAAIASFNIAMALETENKRLEPDVIDAGVREAVRDRDKCLYFVAEIDGQIAGQIMVTYEWSDWRNGNIWWIQSVYVPPAFRRRGVFKALYSHVRSEAVRSDAVALRLYVEKHNTAAQQTYLALGMAMTDYLVMEDGSLRRGD